MNNQINAMQELSLIDDVLRDLLDSEVILIGGGDGAVNAY